VGLLSEEGLLQGAIRYEGTDYLLYAVPIASLINRGVLASCNTIFKLVIGTTVDPLTCQAPLEPKRLRFMETTNSERKAHLRKSAKTTLSLSRNGNRRRWLSLGTGTHGNRHAREVRIGLPLTYRTCPNIFEVAELLGDPPSLSSIRYPQNRGLRLGRELVTDEVRFTLIFDWFRC